MQEEFSKLYEFVNLADKNRKYSANTAHGRRAALKLFETVLHPDERQSLDLIKERIEEIYLSLISQHKDSFSIQSLNTYKGRFIKVLEDYQQYGATPNAIISWQVKQRKHASQDRIKDDKKDTSLTHSSLPVHRGVHKFQISLENGQTCVIEIPPEISRQDAATIQKIIGALSNLT